jgi:hypothetical protein
MSRALWKQASASIWRGDRRLDFRQPLLPDVWVDTNRGLAQQVEMDLVHDDGRWFANHRP